MEELRETIERIKKVFDSGNFVSSKFKYRGQNIEVRGSAILGELAVKINEFNDHIKVARFDTDKQIMSAVDEHLQLPSVAINVLLNPVTKETPARSYAKNRVNSFFGGMAAVREFIHQKATTEVSFNVSTHNIEKTIEDVIDNRVLSMTNLKIE